MISVALYVSGDKTNEVVYEQTLSSEIAHEMYDRAKAFGLSPLTYNATEIIQKI